METFGDKVKKAQRVRAGETILPVFQERTFHCQLCHVYARQHWTRLVREVSGNAPIYVCSCTNCDFESYWFWLGGDHEPRMLWSGRVAAPLPHPEMPDEVRDEYNEAASTIAVSPRGAGAVLRLALQKLMPHLGESGKNLNDDIASLVRKGLDPAVQQALDSLRVIGNNAVHPLELDLRDDTETVGALFDVLNFIIEDRIARPKKMADLYTKLPAGAREAISERDAGTTSS